MTFTGSLIDRLSKALSPIIRTLKDVNTKLLGTKTKVIRISQTDANLLGDKTYTYQSNIIDNVIIQYPFNQVEIFGTKDTSTSDTNSIEFYDLLPINMYTYYEKDQDEWASEIDENDLIVDVLWDQHEVGIPIIMQVTRTYGSFFVKNLISKKYELTLKRGNIDNDIQTIIDAYISGSLVSGSDML